MTTGALAGGDGAEPGDPVLPERIEHGCDEIRGADGVVEQVYNFLDYTFIRDGARLGCRTYLDEAWRVAIWPPPVRRLPIRRRRDDRLRADVLRYLSRRFQLIEELGPDGLTPVWMARHLPAFRAWFERP